MKFCHTCQVGVLIIDADQIYIQMQRSAHLMSRDVNDFLSSHIVVNSLLLCIRDSKVLVGRLDTVTRGQKAEWNVHRPTVIHIRYSIGQYLFFIPFSTGRTVTEEEWSYQGKQHKNWGTVSTARWCPKRKGITHSVRFFQTRHTRSDLGISNKVHRLRKENPTHLV